MAVLDVLAVLNEIKHEYFQRLDHGRPTGEYYLRRLRQDAIERIAKRELSSGRYVNFTSAKHSIHSACTRGLMNYSVGEFDEKLGEWLAGNPARLVDDLCFFSTHYEKRLIKEFFGTSCPDSN